MAFTFTKAQETVFGNQRVLQGVYAADAAAGSVNIGLTKIFSVSATPKSLTTTATQLGTFKINQLAVGTAAAGYLALTGCVAGDEYYVQIFGA
jgi:hypothetical protein